MSRPSIRLSIALLTFTLGCAISTIYRLVQSGTITPPTLPTVEKTLEYVPTACYPGRTLPIEFSNKSSYFSPKTLSTSRISWYSKHLTAMNEPAMHSDVGDGFESYRFLWLRSFHHPVVVRIWKSGNDHFILVKETNGAGGYEPRQLIIDRTRALTAAEWGQFIRLLDQTCYWALPSEDENIEGNDGAQWILEGVKGGRYHVVDRWSPDGGPYREACLYALKLSELKIDTPSEAIY